jgi:hypothetical protein
MFPGLSTMLASHFPEFFIQSVSGSNCRLAGHSELSLPIRERSRSEWETQKAASPEAFRAKIVREVGTMEIPFNTFGGARLWQAAPKVQRRRISEEGCS